MLNFPTLSTALALTTCLVLASCSTPMGGKTRSEYGDKAGPKGFSTVILDAGHGGKDSGAKVGGQMEKTLALDITQRVRAELRSQFKVVLIRDSDVFIELDDRVTKANRYSDAILLSIHLNFGARRISGPETYYWRTDSYSLATRIHRNITSVTSNESGSRGLVRRRLRLTRNPEIPCVLVECGYLTNSREAGQLKDAGYRARIAKSIANAIKEQSAQGDAGMGALPKPIYMPPSRSSDRRDSR